MNVFKMAQAFRLMKKINGGEKLTEKDIPLAGEVLETFNRLSPEQKWVVIEKAALVILKKMKEKETK
jgi:hypothetical protein